MTSQSLLAMPKLGLTMTEGLVVQWLCQPQQRFKVDDIILVIETEKIATEFTAPGNGTLHEILVNEGQTVAVGAPIARWQLEDAEIRTPSQNSVDLTATASTSQASSAQETLSCTEPFRRVRSTPLARRKARASGVELSSVRGTGPGGRIKALDIDTFIAHASIASNGTSDSSEQRKGMSPGKWVMPNLHQAAMAQRLTDAHRDVPHFYLATEVEVGELLQLRDVLIDSGSSKRLTLSAFILLAVARALKEQPSANRIWRENGLFSFETVDVGIAVSTNHGLYSPVLRNVASFSLAQMMEASGTLVDKARAGRLDLNDLGGGATTVSNAGMFDVTYMSSIIAPGQSSIFGVGSIRSVYRPGDDDKPVLSRELGLVLSCDHRVFDGVSGLELLNRVRGYLNRPNTLIENSEGL